MSPGMTSMVVAAVAVAASSSICDEAAPAPLWQDWEWLAAVDWLIGLL